MPRSCPLQDMSGGATADRPGRCCLGLPSLKHLPCHPPPGRRQARHRTRTERGFHWKNEAKSVGGGAWRKRPPASQGLALELSRTRRQRIAHPLSEKRPVAQSQGSPASGTGDDLKSTKDRREVCV